MITPTIIGIAVIVFLISMIIIQRLQNRSMKKDIKELEERCALASAENTKLRFKANNMMQAYKDISDNHVKLMAIMQRKPAKSLEELEARFKEIDQKVKELQ